MQQDNKLKRVLSGFDTVMLGFGAMIGWGWVILAGGWLGDAGYLGAAVAFVIGAIAIIVVGINYAELASAMPFAGGEHVYTERAFGPGISFICTWAILFGYVSSDRRWRVTSDRRAEYSGDQDCNTRADGGDCALARGRRAIGVWRRFASRSGPA